MHCAQGVFNSWELTVIAFSSRIAGESRECLVGMCAAGVDKSINGSLNGRVPIAGRPRPKAL